MIYSNYDTTESNYEIYYDLHGNEIAKCASIKMQI